MQQYLEADSILLAQSGLTIEKANISPQISKLRNENKANLKIIVAKIINEVCLLLQLEINPDQKVFCANMIIQEFWYLKIDDIVLCFKNGVNNHYGKIYGKFNYETMTEWLTQYDKQKANWNEDGHTALKETNQTTKKPFNGFISDILKENKMLKRRFKKS